jgi:PAS domain S-box-containing protein
MDEPSAKRGNVTAETTVSSFNRFSFRKDFPKIFAIALVYFLAHQIAFLFPDSEKVIMLIWPAGGVSLAALLLNPRRLWPGLILAFYVTGIAADVFTAGRSFMAGVGYMTGNMVESIGCACLILHRAEEFRKFTRVREILSLVAGTVFVNALSSCIGAGTSVITRGAVFMDSFQAWYIADGLGVLLIGPFIVSWINIKDSISESGPKKIMEGVAFIAVWSIATWFIFQPIQFELQIRPYVLFALLAWPAIRLGMRGVTLALLLLFVIAINSQTILNESTPWAGKELALGYRLLELQLFLGVMAVAGYLLAASYMGLRQAEKALRKSEALFRALSENSYDAIMRFDGELRHLYANPSVLQQSGIPREAFWGKTSREIGFPLDLVTLWEKTLRRVFDTGAVQRVEFQLPTGVWIDWLCIPESDETGQVQAVITSARDITDRKRTEEALIASENRFRKLVETVSDVIFEFNDKGKITYASPAWLKIWGGDPSETIGKNFIEMVHPEDKERLMARFSDLRRGEECSDTYRFFNKRGQLRWMRSLTTPLMENGRFKGARGVLSDFTAQKQAEEERFELEKQLQQVQRDESLSRMAGAIAHHFNNQLTVVTGNLELVMEKLPRDNTVAKNLSEIMNAARKASEVSGLMLTYLGQTAAKKEPMDICKICRRNLPLFRATLPETIRLETNIPFPGPTIDGNGNQIQQILTNLITNASESCDGQGEVQLTVKTVSAENIPENNRCPMNWQPADTAYACLEVRDSGCGIAEKDIAKIFDPFFTTKFTGRGLGLAVVVGILRSHRGAITVESEPGRGSIFRVFLPVSADEAVLPP